jgi:pyrroloquinoline quinone (PQQ) biosynthesis protein C
LGIDGSLREGRRGLTGGSSLAKLLAEYRGVRNFLDLPPLTNELILAWADSHFEATGEWPKVQSGIVIGVPEEKWANLNQMLQTGGRGLPGGSSIAKLLEEHRGVRNVNFPPRLTEEVIIAWADAHHQRTGDWPTVYTGPLPDVSDESWRSLDSALRKGLRGLPGNSSLASLLSEKRGVRHHLEARPLSIEEILQWADAEHNRTGAWPTSDTGPIVDSPDETWAKIETALASGGRGLPGGSSLAKLLAENRGVRNRKGLQPLTYERILAWADAHYQRTGEWPRRDSGPIQDAPGESWSNVSAALHMGIRGLPDGSSLAQLLSENRGVRNRQQLPELSEAQILAWADAHHLRRGKWPRVLDGPVEDAPGETWSGIQNALRAGLRGLPGGSSLAMLLAEKRGKRNKKNAPRLTIDQILTWADEFYSRTGEWPKVDSGQVHNVPGETWLAIYTALRVGIRGLPGNSNLAALLQEHRGVRNNRKPPSLSVEQILKWVDAHYAQTERWPTQASGSVVDAPDEKWLQIDQALKMGNRGLTGGSSLIRLIQENRLT